jgi:pimeloyl-ACP methyl ester carboxylesterase
VRTITDIAHTNTTSDTLVVLLPGAYNSPEDFLREGFVSAVRERGLSIDIVLADMNLECITDGTAHKQLREEIIQPARHNGYLRIWLIGISIGGFMATLYADYHPGEIDGLGLIAPYPGSRMITETINASGSLLVWSPEKIAEEDYETRFWYWLKQHATNDVEVYLGYGIEDRFATAHAEMSTVIPSHQVCSLPGGHDWQAWKRIWLEFLDRGIFKQ